jgi:hypothetical protein
VPGNETPRLVRVAVPFGGGGSVKVLPRCSGAQASAVTKMETATSRILTFFMWAVQKEKGLLPWTRTTSNPDGQPVVFRHHFHPPEDAPEVDFVSYVVQL